MNRHILRTQIQLHNNLKAGTTTFLVKNNDYGFQKGDSVEISPIGHRNPLNFTIGDVYPIDADRVVFSLLPEKGGEG